MMVLMTTLLNTVENAPIPVPGEVACPAQCPPAVRKNSARIRARPRAQFEPFCWWPHYEPRDQGCLHNVSIFQYASGTVYSTGESRDLTRLVTDQWSDWQAYVTCACVTSVWRPHAPSVPRTARHDL